MGWRVRRFHNMIYQGICFSTQHNFGESPNPDHFVGGWAKVSSALTPPPLPLPPSPATSKQQKQATPPARQMKLLSKRPQRHYHHNPKPLPTKSSTQEIITITTQTHCQNHPYKTSLHQHNPKPLSTTSSKQDHCANNHQPSPEER